MIIKDKEIQKLFYLKEVKRGMLNKQVFILGKENYNRQKLRKFGVYGSNNNFFFVIRYFYCRKI